VSKGNQRCCDPSFPASLPAFIFLFLWTMLCVSILLSASPTVKRLPVCVVTSKTCLPRIAQVSRSKNFLSRWRARPANSNYSSSANMAPPDVSASVTPLPRHGKRRRLVEDVAAGRTSLGPGPANAGDPVGNKEGASHAGMATFPLGLAKGFESAELRLMEATPEVLDALGQGANLRVVGDGLEHPAALVTETATFEMCRVETSNLLLLFPPIEKVGDIGTAAGNVSFHYELKRSKPKQQLLRQLLGEGRVWSLDELETRVQGSRAEVLALLRQMNALQVDGAGKRWRAVSEEKEVSPILDRLLTELMARGKSLEGVAEEDCVALLVRAYPRVCHCTAFQRTLSPPKMLTPVCDPILPPPLRKLSAGRGDSVGSALSQGVWRSPLASRAG